ncbi:amidohydrolase family protein [Streptomyces sp. NPDC060194]|uniref:amidohydrolase family protein n=1 Tax=Streptomyces sp. NPDC060194 TaxID=3347069 RepID=UPI0036522D28
MCEQHAAAPPPASLTRRGVLATAVALAGAGAGADRAVAGGPATSGVRETPGGTLVVENGTLLDPLTGRVIEDAVVVIVRGRVEAAGSRADTAAARRAAEAAEVVDADGGWVLPGLVESHIHLNTLAEARDALSYGATTARSGSTNFYQDIGVRALARAVPGRAPTLRAAGLFVTPDLGDGILADPELAPLARERNGVRSADALRHLVRTNVARGADVIKTRVNERAGLPEQDPTVQVYSREQLATVVAEAGRHGKQVLCHSYAEQGIHDAVVAGVRSIEHGVYVGERTLVEMKRRGTYFTPTLAAMAGMAESSDPVLAERGRTYLPVVRRAVRAAKELGVPVAAGTDSSGGTVKPIGREVELLRAAGLPALDAIRSATTVGARLLGLEREAGRLLRGFRGDVVVVDGSPLDDVTVLKKPRVVVKSGVRYAD